MTKASGLPEEYFKYFPEFEQFEIDLNFMDATFIKNLHHFRYLTGIPMTPSPVIEGWYRKEHTTSRHSAYGRLSDAGDLFPKRGMAFKTFFYALSMSWFGGIGLYIDTKGPDGKDWPMIHLDLRPHLSKTIWIRSDKKYFYFPSDEFMTIMKEIIKGEI